MSSHRGSDGNGELGPRIIEVESGQMTAGTFFPPLVPKSVPLGSRILRLIQSRPFLTFAFTGVFFLLILAIPGALHLHRRLRTNRIATRELNKKLEALKQQTRELQEQITKNEEQMHQIAGEEELKRQKLEKELDGFLQTYEENQEELFQDLQQFRTDNALYRAANELSKKRGWNEFHRSQREYYETIADIRKRLEEDEREEQDYRGRTGSTLKDLGEACLKNQTELEAQKDDFSNGFQATVQAIRALDDSVQATNESLTQTSSTLNTRISDFSAAQVRDHSKLQALATQCLELEETAQSHSERLVAVDKHGRMIGQLESRTDSLLQASDMIGHELVSKKIMSTSPSKLAGLIPDSPKKISHPIDASSGFDSLPALGTPTITKAKATEALKTPKALLSKSKAAPIPDKKGN